MTPMGRPKIENPNTINLTVRINKELNDKLNEYCKIKGVTKGEIVRRGILDIIENNGPEAIVKVNMGKAIFECEKIPMIFSKNEVINEYVTINDKSYGITCVSMGNPHCAVFCEEVYSADVKGIGTKLSTHSMFPEGVNVEFLSIIDSNNIAMRVWERGSGETLACGTGASAVLVACVLNNLTDNLVNIHLQGGTLTIEWNKQNNHIYMEGPANIVYEGII